MLPMSAPQKPLPTRIQMADSVQVGMSASALIDAVGEPYDKTRVSSTPVATDVWYFAASDGTLCVSVIHNAIVNDVWTN